VKAPGSRPLRVLLVADSLDVGGAERHVVGLATTLAGAGHTVVIACSTQGALTPMALRAGVAVRPLGVHLVKRRLSVPFAWKLRRFVREGRFDLVHAHMYASAVASAFATLGTAVPLVLTEHSEAGWRTPRVRLGCRLAYRRARRIIAVSEGIRQRLIKRDGARVDRVAVIPNALPATDERALPSLPNSLSGGPIVGVVARLQPEKGIEYFVKAAAQVASQLPSAEFIVVGGGPMQKDLVRLARRLGVSERVHFLGFRMDGPSLVRLFDVVVVPSLSEGTPLVVLEAMAAGVPVVASAVGGIPEQVRHGCEGLLVPPADSAALAEAIVGLLRDPDRARGLGEAGRRRVTAHYGHAAMVRKTEAVYRAALKRSEPLGRAAPAEPARRLVP
jgi:glycosyltransferase involved in cell wall biosynthesis